ncbi:MAG: hypothetical protein FWB72_03435 [Firmicutes bacterium]|nr:hypothetical protein [Bacillota bacterium]
MTKRLFRILLVLSLATMMAFVLVACGNGNGDDNGYDNGDITTPVVPTGVTLSVPAGGAQLGGTGANRTVTLTVGGTLAVTAAVAPTTAEQTITWEAANNAHISRTVTGLVATITAVSVGESTIRAVVTGSDPVIATTLTVTVQAATPPPEPTVVAQRAGAPNSVQGISAAPGFYIIYNTTTGEILDLEFAVGVEGPVVTGGTWITAWNLAKVTLAEALVGENLNAVADLLAEFTVTSNGSADIGLFYGANSLASIAFHNTAQSRWEVRGDITATTRVTGTAVNALWGLSAWATQQGFGTPSDDPRVILVAQLLAEIERTQENQGILSTFADAGSWANLVSAWEAANALVVMGIVPAPAAHATVLLLEAAILAVTNAYDALVPADFFHHFPGHPNALLEPQVRDAVQAMVALLPINMTGSRHWTPAEYAAVNLAIERWEGLSTAQQQRIFSPNESAASFINPSVATINFVAQTVYMAKHGLFLREFGSPNNAYGNHRVFRRQSTWVPGGSMNPGRHFVYVAFEYTPNSDRNVAGVIGDMVAISFDARSLIFQGSGNANNFWASMPTTARNILVGSNNHGVYLIGDHSASVPMADRSFLHTVAGVHLFIEQLLELDIADIINMSELTGAGTRPVGADNLRYAFYDLGLQPINGAFYASAAFFNGFIAAVIASRDEVDVHRARLAALVSEVWNITDGVWTNAHVQENYTTASWAAFNTAVNGTNAAVARVTQAARPTLAQINTARTNLINARNALVTNLSVLQGQVVTANNVFILVYVDNADMDTFLTAIESAQAVINNAGRTQQQIADAGAALTAARLALTPVAEGDRILVPTGTAAQQAATNRARAELMERNADGSFVWEDVIATMRLIQAIDATTPTRVAVDAALDAWNDLSFDEQARILSADGATRGTASMATANFVLRMFIADFELTVAAYEADPNFEISEGRATYNVSGQGGRGEIVIIVDVSVVDTYTLHNILWNPATLLGATATYADAFLALPQNIRAWLLGATYQYRWCNDTNQSVVVGPFPENVNRVAGIQAFIEELLAMNLTLSDIADLGQFSPIFERDADGQLIYYRMVPVLDADGNQVYARLFGPRRALDINGDQVYTTEYIRDADGNVTGYNVVPLYLQNQPVLDEYGNHKFKLDDDGNRIPLYSRIHPSPEQLIYEQLGIRLMQGLSIPSIMVLNGLIAAAEVFFYN